MCSHFNKIDRMQNISQVIIEFVEFRYILAQNSLVISKCCQKCASKHNLYCFQRQCQMLTLNIFQRLPHFPLLSRRGQCLFRYRNHDNNNYNQMIDEAKTLLANPIKIIILGKVSVGKTSILLKYASNHHQLNKETIGIDVLTKVVAHMGKSYRLELWDTAGHERYRTVVYNYFYLANAALVIFDISDESSLDEARKWLTQIRLHSQDKIPVVLIGNKSDLFVGEDLKKVIDGMKGKIQDITGQFSCQFFVVSALKGENIQLGFLYLLEKLIQRGFARGETRQSTKTIKLGSQIYLKAQKRKRRCC